MPRPSGSILAAAFGALVAAHAALSARGLHARWLDPGALGQNGVWLLAALAVALLGRLALSFLPPGEPGGHAPRALPETAATSLALGWLACGFAFVPAGYLWSTLAERGSPAARWLPFSLVLGLLLVLGLGRRLTLPGAMVPRHALAQESFGRARPWLAAAALAWLAFCARTDAFVPALAWLALGILLERGLLCARRAAAGRLLFLVAFVAHVPGPSGVGELWGLTQELGLAAALGAGAASLIPWLRRADRRAGLLAGLFLAAPLLLGRDGLAWAGLVVYVAAAHPRQRPAALRTAVLLALLFAWIGWWLAGPARGRLLLGGELLRVAFELGASGLAWPLVLAALLLGAATFPWRAEPWSPGTIEPPRREALALAALVGLVALALALPSSPWFEAEALVILFPPLALLAGLLVIPPERPPGG